VNVTEQRKRQGRGARECVMAERAVAADGEQGGAARGDLGRDLSQVAELGASDPAEVVAVEDEHDVGPAAEVRERHAASAGGRKAQNRSGLAESE
jgi:hypothetical protein